MTTPQRTLAVLIGVISLLATTLPNNGPAQAKRAVQLSDETPISQKIEVGREASSGTSTEKAPSEKAVDHYNEGVRLFLASQSDSRINAKASYELLQQAEKEFKKAIRYDKELLVAYSNLGYVYLSEKRHRTANKYFEKALAIDPNHKITLAGYGITKSELKENDEAVSILTKLTNLEPDSERHWFNLGTVYQKSDKPNQAQDAYEQALLRNPQHQPSMFNMGTLYHAQLKYDLAWTYYERCVQMNPGSPLALQAQHRLKMLETQKTSPDAPTMTPEVKAS